MAILCARLSSTLTGTFVFSVHFWYWYTCRVYMCPVHVHGSGTHVWYVYMCGLCVLTYICVLCAPSYICVLCAFNSVRALVKHRDRCKFVFIYKYVWHGAARALVCMYIFYMWHASCEVTHSYVWHDPFMCVAWLMHVCDVTHSYVWHDTPSYVWHDSFICVTWTIHVCDMTHCMLWSSTLTRIFVGHDSFMCVIWLIHMCEMTHLYERQKSFICVTPNIQMCYMVSQHLHCQGSEL